MAGQAQVVSQAASPSIASLQASHGADLAAAQQGDQAAQLRVGKAYNEGILLDGTKVVRRNYGEASKWFQAAAGQGSQEAKAWLGSLYLLGRGVVPNTEQAKALIEEAAANGNGVGLRFMGLMYETGRGVPRDYRKAVGYYQQAVRAQDVNANDRLGVMYLRGMGVQRSPRKAFQLFTSGAGLGDAWAELNLGEMYYGGHVPTGTVTAAETASGDLGSGDGDNNNTGGGGGGLKGTPDFATASKYFEQSARQGNRVAAYKLGQMYEGGVGVSQDYGQALRYYKEAASRLYGPALVAVGEANEVGRGTGVNLTQAYIEYNLALEANEGRAQGLLQSLVRRLDGGQLRAAQAGLEAYRRHATQGESGE